MNGLKSRFDSFYAMLQEHEPDETSGISVLKHIIKLSIYQKKYRCNKNEYFNYKLYKKTPEEISEYAMENGFVTRYITRLNSEEAIYLTSNKNVFIRKFPQYVNRDWLVPAEAKYADFELFASKHPECIAKPLDGQSGDGVYVMQFPEKSEWETFFAQLQKENLILEERLTQEASLAEFNPDSVNTIRLVTLRRGEEIELVMSALRIGRKGKCADNVGAGGMIAKVDFASGIVTGAAMDKNNRYEIHPDSGKRIVGFQVPCWQEIKEVTMACALEMPGDFVAWDLAVNGQGQVVLIEANSAPDIMYIQVAEGRGFAKLLKG